MIRAPQPPTTRALLINAKTGQATWHRYIATHECVLPPFAFIDDIGEATGGGPAWEYIFECELTGLQRVWGNSHRQASEFDEKFEVKAK